VGLLAEVGRVTLSAIPRPTVAILSTGNELVPAAETPGPGQIRNSNGPMLAALVQSAGAVPHDLGIARDEPDELRRLIADGLRSGVLVLSGGVSAGVLDLVPGVLAELGVRQVFHKVNLKPGKPLWFGVRADAECGTRNPDSTAAETPHSAFRIPNSSALVFGLPGNPVSTLVCFELFVRPALRRLAGRPAAEQQPLVARLTRDFTHKGNRPTYHPARLDTADGRPVVAPVAWQGSADLRAFAEANALVHFPEGDRHFPAGQEVEVLRLP
jgi:molybdopterin molybdotransferase